MQTLPQIILDSRTRNFDGRHPWVMAHSIIEPTLPIENGTHVDLVRGDGNWIGRGVYNTSSRIRVRLYQWNQAASLDSEWLHSQLEYALQLRETYGNASQLSSLRLVNSEGDGLSGLIVDRFGDYVIVQLTSLAMWQWREEIVEWLVKRLSPAGIRVLVDTSTASNESIPETDEWIHGAEPAEEFVISDFGIQLSIDLKTGQKTGYYLDQRANRQVAAQWIERLANHRKPIRMLDVCCYLGGFSLAAAAKVEGAKVVAVDSSARALQAASKNAELNGIDNIEFVEGDCFDELQKQSQTQEKFDAVILDPPRMASHKKQVPAALRAYHRLNLMAVNALNHGGLLVTCSCTGRVSREDFTGLLASVGKRTQRQIQLLEIRGADFDHPVAANCPEGEYLKCAICRVE